LEAILRCQ